MAIGFHTGPGLIPMKVSIGILDKMRDAVYLSVITPAPLILVRVPKDIPWHRILRALTRVMRDHKMRQKDISRIEALIPPPEERTEEDERFAGQLEQRWGDPDYLAPFWLYDWGVHTFDLVRSPSR